ncbi:alpha/beta hydrolase fold domain-containing protein [Ancylobacter moscoviensis]
MPDRPDYDLLLDAPIRDFIRATEEFYPPETATLSIADQRAVYDRMCGAFFRGYPRGVTAEDRRISGVPCRIYPGAGPATVIYVHGGGYVVGGLHSHDDVCAEICSETGLTVIAVDYRLAPEWVHPAAFEDVCSVLRAVEGAVVLVGDSAGGNLAAAAAHACRDPRILGQVLIYPTLGGLREGGSFAVHAHAPMLTMADMAFYVRIRHDGAQPPADDPSVAPLQDRDFAGLPMTFAVAAEYDPLADDASDYAARIRAAGGLAHAVTEAGLVHSYLRARSTVPRAAESFARILLAIAAFAKGEWPYG